MLGLCRFKFKVVKMKAVMINNDFSCDFVHLFIWGTTFTYKEHAIFKIIKYL